MNLSKIKEEEEKHAIKLWIKKKNMPLWISQHVTEKNEGENFIIPWIFQHILEKNEEKHDAIKL